MRILLLLAGAAGMALTAPALAKPEQGRGGGGGGPQARGGGGGGGQQARGGGGGPRQQAQGGGGQRQQAKRGGGPRQQAERGGGPRRMAQGGGGPRPQATRGGGPRQMAQGGDAPKRAERGGGRGNAERRADRKVERNQVQRDRASAQVRGKGRDQQQRADVRRQVERPQQQMVQARGGKAQRQEGGGKAQRQEARRMDRQAVRLTNGSQVARLRWDGSFSGTRGCPPGLAKRDNGCMPPGLERQQLAQVAAQQAWYDDWWSYPQQEQDFIYDDGYLFQLGQQGSVESYIPLLGGALFPGQQWPSSFNGYDVPEYHVDYYGLNDSYDYQLADGAIYGLDPTTQAIQQVAALVTGDDWAIGQEMPQGYDVYNVPYDYRDQYADTPESMYRYSDGYVYQVDPTTQLIQAAIQLIT